MRKIIISATLLLSMPAIALASTIEVESETAIIAEGAYHPVLSADGSKLLYSGDNYRGLNLLDLESMQTQVLSTSEGAGFSAMFGADDSDVYFREIAVEKNLRKRNVVKCDLQTMAKSEVLPMSRNKVKMLKHAEGVLITDNGREVAGTAAGTATVAYGNHKTIVVEKDGLATEIDPVDDAHSYLWVSVSPDGNKLLFVEPFKGLFMCDLDGTGLKRIAEKAVSPSWFGNGIVLYTRSTDDGYHIESSQIMAVDVATGQESALTAPEAMVEEASGSISAGVIVCTDIQGAMKVLKVKIAK